MLHEVGHLVAYYSIDKKWREVSFDGKNLVVGTDEEYEKLNRQEKQIVLFWGIVFGLAAIIPTFWLPPTLLLTVFKACFVYVYVYGSMSDIVELVKLLKGDE